MSDLEKEVQRAVEAFVKQIIETTRHAAQEALQSAFQTASTAALPEHSGGRAGGDHPRRTPEDLEALSERLTALVQATPGLRIEQINERLGTTTKELALPVRKLLAGGLIYGKGETRSKAYFAISREIADLNHVPTFGARSQAVEHVVGERTTEPVVERVDGASSINELDTDWCRSLAGVFALARRLQK
jgi:hypothetical protein